MKELRDLKDLKRSGNQLGFLYPEVYALNPKSKHAILGECCEYGRNQTVKARFGP